MNHLTALSKSCSGAYTPAVMFTSREKPRIVMVEDDYQKEVNKTLQGFDHEMVAMADCYDTGKAAVEKHQPEIILMDQMIRSRKDGYDLAKDLVASGFPKERILFISNSWVGTFPGFAHVQKTTFFDHPERLLNAIKKIAEQYLPSEKPADPT